MVNKRTKKIEIRVSKAEYEQLLQRKTKARLAEWIRETCLGSELSKKAKALLELTSIEQSLGELVGNADKVF